MTAGIVIIGAGEAGVSAASSLRDKGYDGRLTIFGAELDAPYERPPLSKSVMVGEPVAPIRTATRFNELEIDFRPGETVSGLDRAARVVLFSEGQRLSYDKLLLATGARARQLTIKGGELALTLRSLGDALKIRSRLAPGKRLVIIGGGFIGLELAASARMLGVAVVVLEAAPRLLMRGVPAEIATMILHRHTAAGVEIRTGVELSSISVAGDAYSVTLGVGETLSCDAVVAGIGASPDTELGVQSGLEIDNGIKVNGLLQSSDPHVFAAGDCCSFPHPLYDGRRIRLESWRNAIVQGEAAAATMLGGTEVFSAVPWFWSDQYDVTLQITGLADGAARSIRRDLGEGAMILFHLAEDGRLLAASGFGTVGRIAKEIRLAEFLIAARSHPDAEDLASPEVKLKSLLRA